MTRVRDKLINKHSEVCDIIERLYPNTLRFAWKDGLVDSIVLVDTKITRGKLKLRDMGNNIVAFEPLAMGYQVVYIHLRLNLLTQNGFIFFKTDIGLSDESCARMYLNNIDIRINAEAKFGLKYDRQAIMRRYTIKEIIK